MITNTIEKTDRKVKIPRQGSGRCPECGKYYRCINRHYSEIRSWVVALSQHEKAWIDQTHPKLSKAVHTTINIKSV